jgi:hypothetical protein
VFPDKEEGAEEKDTTVFSKLGNSNNMTGLSSKKRKRDAVQFLTTKSCAKSANESESGEEIRLNPIMRDLIINGYADRYNTQDGKSKGKKQ